VREREKESVFLSARLLATAAAVAKMSLGYQVEVHIYRDSLTSPWGFRLAGGKDFNAPLIVQRVQPGTPSESHLERGDVILSVEGNDVTNFTHAEALALLNRGAGNVIFGLIRGCSNPMSLMIKSEVVTVSGTITSYTFDGSKAQRLPTMAWDPTLFVRNNPILHARKDAIEAVKAKGPENPDDPVEPIAPAPVPFVPPKPINHREMAHKISKTVVEQAVAQVSAS